MKTKQTEPEQRAVAADEESATIGERHLIQNDLDHSNILGDNASYYVSEDKVKYWLLKLEYKNCGSELLLDPNHCHTCMMSSYPMYTEFVASK